MPTLNVTIMRILLVEDNQEISGFLKKRLEKEYFIVDLAEDGERGATLARLNHYDLVILDYILPKKDGHQVCREIRQKKKKLPIIILSVEAEITLKVKLLDIGADDYLTKPFSFEELLARIRALLRRPQELTNPLLTAGNLALDTKKHSVTRNKKKIYLTRKEFMILELLMKKKGEVISRADILEHAWDMNFDPFSNTVETHIRNLRRKIEPKDKKYILTVSGKGYKLNF